MQALRLARAGGNIAGQIDALNGLGLAHRMGDLYAPAAEHLQLLSAAADLLVVGFQCRDGHRFSPIALACLMSSSTWTWERWRASSQATCPVVV